MRVWLRIGIAALAAASVTAAARPWVAAQGRAAVAIDPDDIGGVVSSAKGPEAGVWVIAETTETPTRFIRIVVTDDQGRYVMPDLPRANFDVFVRGYGLVDSPRREGEAGTAARSESGRSRRTPGRPPSTTRRRGGWR